MVSIAFNSTTTTGTTQLIAALEAHTPFPDQDERIVRLASLLGFFANDGATSPDFIDDIGRTELVYVAGHTGAQGLKVFFEHGGRVHSAMNIQTRELGFLVDLGDPHSIALYLVHGGSRQRSFSNSEVYLEALDILKEAEGKVSSPSLQPYTA